MIDFSMFNSLMQNMNTQNPLFSMFGNMMMGQNDMMRNMGNMFNIPLNNTTNTPQINYNSIIKSLRNVTNQLGNGLNLDSNANSMPFGFPNNNILNMFMGNMFSNGQNRQDNLNNNTTQTENDINKSIYDSLKNNQ